MPLLIDFGPHPDCCTDDAIEALYKSLAVRPDEGIWRRHESPWLADHVEAVTARGQAILGAMQDALAGDTLLAKATPWTRLNATLRDRLAEDLRDKPIRRYSLNDWYRLIDWVISTYLPDHVIQTEAEYLAVRAVFVGRAQAQSRAVDDAVAAALAQRLPATVRLAERVATFSGRMGQVLRFARERAAEAITEVSQTLRGHIRRVVLRYEETKAMGEPVTVRDLQTQLQEQFASLNRDWRRVAITEAGNAASEGLLASLTPGSRVKRWEHYVDACPFCRRLHGMVLTVVDPSKPDKDGWAEVWPGKTNVGRSAAPRKRVGDVLVERSPEELWWPAAGTQHPNCRGHWDPVRETAAPVVDPRFHDWLTTQLDAIDQDLS